MRQKVKILHNDEVLFNGKLQDLPLKKEYIIKRSVELFDDEDPCIIHQSYVVKDYVDKILETLVLGKSVPMNTNMELYSSLQLESIEELTIELLG